MNALDAIMTRRSIRRYTDARVEDGKLDLLLRAAMAAPSAGNQQPWHFVVVRERERLEALAAASPYAQMLPSAPVAIVVCGDTQDEVHSGFWVQDCSAAVMNLLLAAHDLGLGAVWLGFHPREERVRAAQRVLGLPERVIPLAVVPVGYPAETKAPANRHDPRRVHRERW